jgi:hypothetical protein
MVYQIAVNSTLLLLLLLPVQTSIVYSKPVLTLLVLAKQHDAGSLADMPLNQQ